MHMLDADALARALPMPAAIHAMRAAFGTDVENPLRVALGACLFMTARVQSFTGVKVVSTVPGNPQGTVSVYNDQGAPVGMVDGSALTLLRTGAASGLATDLLAPRGACSLAMLGAGAVAPQQIAAVRCVRAIRRIRIWSRRSSAAAQLAQYLQQLWRNLDVDWVEDANDAVAQAEVICCATPATAPLFDAQAVQPGAHINAVGAFQPGMVEVPAATVRAARVFVDQLQAAQAEAGDLLAAQCTPHGTLTDLLQGAAGRTAPNDITLFKSVGIASQDVAAAVVALCGAAALELPGV